MIDIEQYALRTFEQNFGSCLANLLEPLPHRLGELEHKRSDFAQLRKQFLPIDGWLVETRTKRIVMGAETVQLRVEVVEMRKVAYPNGSAANLVLVSRPDPATGCPDLARSGSRLPQSVKVAVKRQDQRAVVCDSEVVGIDLDALPLELFHLGLEMPGVQHHAIADNAQGAGDDTARQ